MASRSFSVVRSARVGTSRLTRISEDASPINLARTKLSAPTLAYQNAATPVIRTEIMLETSAHTSRQPVIHRVVSGRGPHVTLVHGVGANLQSWDEVTTRLEPHFTVVRLDLRGHGKSGAIVGACSLDDL